MLFEKFFKKRKNNYSFKKNVLSKDLNANKITFFFLEKIPILKSPIF